MQNSSQPKLIPTPFADNGARQNIPNDSQIGIIAGRASYNDGFPPLTRTPLAAGGVPPFGTDFNGVLNDITSAIRWAQAGSGYPFNTEFNVAIGGYPKGATIPNSTLDGYWLNTVEGNTSNPEAPGATITGWVPAENYGATSISGLSGSSITLSTLQASKEKIYLDGTLSSNINLTLPAWVKTWFVINNCSGNFSVTVKTPSGSGVAIPAGGSDVLMGNGTDIQSALSLIGLGGGGSSLPVGVPVPWPTSTPPAGWITMSGQSISQSQLPKLYAAYGAKLPDLRGEFIRGWDNGRGLDPSRALLNEQLPTGIRQFTGNNDVQFQGLGITQLVNPDGNDGYDSGWAVARNANQTTNSSGCNVSFVRPRNVSFNYIVRAA